MASSHGYSGISGNPFLDVAMYSNSTTEIVEYLRKFESLFDKGNNLTRVSYQWPMASCLMIKKTAITNFGFRVPLQFPTNINWMMNQVNKIVGVY
jgi:hypothetical protein